MGRDVLDRIAELIADRHRTTLVFVNNASAGSERVAHHLSWRSACRRGTRRQPTTAASPRSAGCDVEHAAASDRRAAGAGGDGLARTRHRHRSRSTSSARSDRRAASRPSCSASGAPGTRVGVRHQEGASIPGTRDELVESAALLTRAVRAGRLDRDSCQPVAPLDVLAQQIVAAECAAREWSEKTSCSTSMRRAASVPRARAQGLRRGARRCSRAGLARAPAVRRAAYLHRDRIERCMLRARRASRMVAIQNGRHDPRAGRTTA